MSEIDKDLKNSLLTDGLPDVKLQLPDDIANDEVIEYIGLKKEELLKYVNDPYWRKLRIILLVLFGIIWLFMLGMAIAIIVLAPRCPPTPNLQWWQKAATIYYLHPRSFMDTDANGQGDIQGIVKELSYLKDNLGVRAINIGPMQHSPQLNFGYDVTDHKTVCHRYGSVNQFEHLVHEAHKKDLKVLVDFVPNHTSKKHLWFQLSRNRTHGFEDVYVWKDGKNGQPPNNWMSVYGGSAWEFDDERGEFYYHTYSKYEPDLNLRNLQVLQLLDDALFFWLGKKIDGVRLVGAEYLLEDPDFIDLPNTKQMMSFQNESNELVSRWRNLIDLFSHNASLPRSYQFERLLMVSESGDSFNKSIGGQITLNKMLMTLNNKCRAECLCNKINQYITGINAPPPNKDPSKYTYNWQTGDFGESRLTSLVDSGKLINVLHLMHLFLPGPSIIYFGDEIGMTTHMTDVVPVNTTLTEETLSRGLTLSPMQWSDGHMAGFTEAVSAWLPINEDYKFINVRHELAEGSPRSLIHLFHDANRLIESEASLQWGDLQMFHEGDVLYWRRYATGHPDILIAINVGFHPATINFKESRLVTHLIGDEANVVMATHSIGNLPSSLSIGSVIKLSKTIYLREGDGIVLKVKVTSKLFF